MNNLLVAHCQSRSFMKTTSLISLCSQRAARGVVLGCASLLVMTTSAQNLLKNGDFESPLDPWDPTGLTGGKTNWALVYDPTSGGPGTFAMKGRSTESSHNGATQHGVHLRPTTEC